MAKKQSIKKKSKKSFQKGKAKKDTRLNLANFKKAYYLIAFVAIAGILVISPFNRGLFFSREFLTVHLISFLLLSFWWIVKVINKDENFIKTPLEIIIFTFMLSYFLSIFGAVNTRVAVGEFLKVTNYFIIYLLVFDICRQKRLFSFKWRKNREETDSGSATAFISLPAKALLHLFFISGTIVALASLGHAAGLWTVPGSYVGGRIYSPLQYSNAAASFFMASYFLCLGLIPLLHKWHLKPLYAAPAAILMTSLLLTFSRGAWFLVPILMLLFLLISQRGSRLSLFFYFITTTALSAYSAYRLDSSLQAGLTNQALLNVLITVFAAVALGFLGELFLKVNNRYKTVSLGIVSALILLTGLFWIIQEVRSPLHLETTLMDPPREQYLKDIVNINEGEDYTLSLKVNAQSEEISSEEKFAWRLVVLGFILDEKSTDFESRIILDHREGDTGGWQNRKFSLPLEDKFEKLEVQIHNYYPGTSISVDNVILKGDNHEHKISFFFSKALPPRVYDRVFSLRNIISAEQRLVHQQDALKVIKDYPIWGAGGGGWQSLYLSYIDKEYFTTEPHSHFLKVWLETGILGFLTFLAISFTFAFMFFRNLLNNNSPKENKAMWAAVFIPTAGLILHSLIDFNLSLGSISIFLFTLFGIGSSLDTQEYLLINKWRKREKQIFHPWAVSTAGIIISLFLFYFTYSLWTSIHFSDKAMEKIEEEEITEAIGLLIKASNRDPFRGENYMLLAELYKNEADLANNDHIERGFMEESLKAARRAYELEPFNPEYNRQYGLMLLQFGLLDEGLYHIDRLADLHPFSVEYLIQIAAARMSVGEYYLQAGDEAKGKDAMEGIVQLEDRAIYPRNENTPLSFYLGKASLLLEDLELARKHLEAVDESDVNYEEAIYYLEFINNM